MEISQWYILLYWSSDRLIVRRVPASKTSRVFESQKARRVILCTLSTRSDRVVERLYGFFGESEELRQERKSTTHYDHCSFGLAREGLSV